jgi:hypothetical protein
LCLLKQIGMRTEIHATWEGPPTEEIADGSFVSVLNREVKRAGCAFRVNVIVSCRDLRAGG